MVRKHREKNIRLAENGNILGLLYKKTNQAGPGQAMFVIGFIGFLLRPKERSCQHQWRAFTENCSRTWL